MATRSYRDYRSNSMYPEVPTRLVDVHVKMLRPKYDSLFEWMENPNNVYIGRHMRLNRKGKVRKSVPTSQFANPHKIKDIMNEFPDISEEEARNISLERYERDSRKALRDDPILVEELCELKGKTLGCWCGDQPCHGDVIIKLIEEMCQ